MSAGKNAGGNIRFRPLCRPRLPKAGRYARYIAVALLILLCGCVLPVLSFRYDNKYTRPRPYAKSGVIRLDMDWYQGHPFFYLVDGWDFYQDKLLTPEELPQHTPDRNFYLGRYGGFDLGDPDADPHGRGTYRMVILTDGTEREYALELTQIYSAWDLWINGKLVQSVGMGREKPPSVDNRMVTFKAKEQIEIVVAVTDESHFYSGMVYPPAFGSIQKVGLTLSLRLLIHGCFCAVALLIAILCLFWGLGCRFTRPYGALALLCLACCGAGAWPVFQTMGFYGEAWYLLERVCYYGIFLAAVWLQGRICRLPRKVVWPACFFGVLVEGLILFQPLVPVHRAVWYLRFSALLSAYKWFTALWLTATGIWAFARKREYAGVMTAGSCIFALSLVMGRLLPVHEPVLFGWFVEIAAGILVFLVTGILWYDTVSLYKESVQLKAGRELAQIQLEAREEQAAIQQEYVRRTREQLHESRHRLTLIRHYLDTGAIGQLSSYVDELTADMSGRDSREYTGNRLIDALLTAQLKKADQLGIYVELDLDALPGRLPVADDDITVLLLNLLDNALESCSQIAAQEERWSSHRMELDGARLQIECSNAAVFPDEGKKEAKAAEPVCETGTRMQADPPARSSKADKRAHGFGIATIRNIVSEYGGSMDIGKTEDSYHVVLKLYLKFC